MKTISQLGRRFWRDESGVAVILVAVMLPVIIGFALLAIDMSRANNLHNDLQKGADAFALAAAAELDGGPDAITRANRALANLVDNTQRFSTTGVQTLLTSAGITTRFLHTLPVNDWAVNWEADATASVTTDPLQARFVEVTVSPTGFAAIFPASFISNTLSNNFNIGAKAVAGFGSAVCNFTPVFICNPYEGSPGGITLAQAVAERQYRRRLIELRSVGGGSSYFPGNFGFLDSPGANGARGLAEMIASSRPRSCYSSAGVDTKTGQNSGPVKGAFNLRFGIQEPGTGSYNSAEYGPAQNVRKGAVRTSGNANQCPSSNQLTFGAPNQGLPPDPCFTSNTCTLMGGRMGDGNWNFSTYWATNFGSASYPAGWATSGANLPSRYEVYRHEIEFNGGSLIAQSTAPATEKGTPPSGCVAPVTTVDRRLIYGAIINCTELEAAGRDLGGHEEDVPVEAFASFFITEPVRKVPNSEYDASLLVELVDVTGLAGAGTLENFERDDVQLYR